MADIVGRFNQDMVVVYLLQEPYVAYGQVCGLGNGLSVYYIGEWPKAAIAVRKGVCDVVLRCELSNECMCVVNISLEGRDLLLASSYCQHGGDIELDIDYIRRIVQRADRVPLLVGLDANATSLAWHSKNLQAAQDIPYWLTISLRAN